MRTDGTENSKRCDILVRNATVMDGTGGKGIRADVAIVEDRIAAVGALPDMQADVYVEGADRVLAPGFIDTHAHDDHALVTEPGMRMKISQGVTSVVIGNCGFSMAPLTPERSLPSPLQLFGQREDFCYPSMESYFRAVQSSAPATNVATLVGHSTLRVGAMRDLEKPASAEELQLMERRLDESMAAGAIGFSTGMFYDPSIAATQDEAAALARVCGRRGGIYATHIRDEADGILGSLEEAFAIASP